MRSSRLLALAAVAVCVAAVASGCSDDQVKLGPPDGLQGKKPLEDNPGTVMPPPVPSGDAGPVVPTKGCTPPPATLAADCPTYTKDIFGALMDTGKSWGCATAACHGPAGSLPLIQTLDQSYAALQAYKIDNKPYINTGCIEPDQGTFNCNISATPCGAGKMPQVIQPPLATQHIPTAAEIATLGKWTACGSPK